MYLALALKRKNKKKKIEKNRRKSLPGQGPLRKALLRKSNLGGYPPQTRPSTKHHPLPITTPHHHQHPPPASTTKP
tara:strand:- start:105 stop:332 length:228 start_codon:yes stop_codon:yes gene_type:complete